MSFSTHYEELSQMSYRQLQAHAKLHQLPGNLKQKVLVKVIMARRVGKEAEVARIIEEEKEERAKRRANKSSQARHSDDPPYYRRPGRPKTKNAPSSNIQSVPEDLRMSPGDLLSRAQSIEQLLRVSNVPNASSTPQMHRKLARQQYAEGLKYQTPLNMKAISPLPSVTDGSHYNSQYSYAPGTYNHAQQTAQIKQDYANNYNGIDDRHNNYHTVYSGPYGESKVFEPVFPDVSNEIIISDNLPPLDSLLPSNQAAPVQLLRFDESGGGQAEREPDMPSQPADYNWAYPLPISQHSYPASRYQYEFGGQVTPNSDTLSGTEESFCASSYVDASKSSSCSNQTASYQPDILPLDYEAFQVSDGTEDSGYPSSCDLATTSQHCFLREDIVDV